MTTVYIIRAKPERMQLLLHWFDLDFVYNQWIALFASTTFLLNSERHVFLASSSSEKPTSWQGFQMPLLEKKGEPFPMKSVTFCWTWIVLRKIANVISNFTWQSCFPYPLNDARNLRFLVGGLPSLWLLESVAVLGLSVVFREAYNAGQLYLWYRVVDIHSILLHVEFANELSILVLKNEATRLQKRTAGNHKLS
jgi:hypothetical protein